MDDTEALVPTNFTEQLARAERPGSLLVLTGNSKGLLLVLEKSQTILGRADEADLILTDPGVSRQHARVEVNPEGGQVSLVDLESTNGIHVNGQKVTSCSVEDGDLIDLGAGVTLSFGHRDPLEGEIQSQLYEDAIRDGLTGLKNRKYVDERLAQEFTYAKRREALLSIIMLDLDNFKLVNDTYGHAAGDAVLQELSRRVSQLVRTEDVLARYGGEEFVLVLRSTDLEGARTLAERIRVSIGDLPVTLPNVQQAIAITVSLGVATLGPQSFPTAESLLKAADAALYRAKAAGRNRVELHI